MFFQLINEEREERIRMRTQNGKEASKPDAANVCCAHPIRLRRTSNRNRIIQMARIVSKFPTALTTRFIQCECIFAKYTLFASARDCRKNIAHFCHVIAHKLHEICDEQQNRTFIRIFNCRAFTDSSGGFIIAQRLNCKKNRKLAMCLFCCKKCD